jgi:DNA-binding MarR family transcriptional regulator
MKCAHVPERDDRFMSEHLTARANGDQYLRVLEALDGVGHVSQRDLGDEVGLAASQVNRIIRSLVADGHLRVTEDQVRPYAYALTDRGREHLRRLAHVRYAAVVKEFLRVQARIRARLAALRTTGVSRVALYGAGEILDVARPLARAAGLEVVAVPDDDPSRQGTRSAGMTVRPPDAITDAGLEAVVITSFRHAGRIRERLEASSFAGQVVEL